MSAFFDSRSLAHRSPFGAVEESTEVLLRIRMPRSWGCSGAQLLIEPDGRPREQWGMFWAGMDGDEHEWWDIRYTPTAPGVYWYGFQVTLALGTGWLVRRSDGTAGYSYESPGPFWQLTCYEKGFTTPDWLAGGVLYQIFPDRFAASGSQKAGVPTDRVLHTSWDEPPHWQPDAQGRIRNNDYAGGDLDGITQKLPYLAGLGVTCLYLNPIFEAHSNHRYDTADYTHIDPLLGDEAALHRLTAEAARHGIRVLLEQRHITADELESVEIAGGFGNYLKPESAVRIGMLPKGTLGKLRVMGNTALAGASMLALDGANWERLRSIPAKCRDIELSGRDDFADAFTYNLTF